MQMQEFISSRCMLPVKNHVYQKLSSSTQNGDGVCANLNALNSSCLDDTQKKEDAQKEICGPDKSKGGPGYSSNGIILTCNNTQPINHSDCEELTVILSIIIGVLCIALLPSLWMCLVHVRKRILTRRQARPTVSNSRRSSETTERPMNGNVIRSLEATVLPTRNQSQWSNIPTTIAADIQWTVASHEVTTEILLMTIFRLIPKGCMSQDL